MGVDDRTSISSTPKRRQSDFRRRVVERDGTCVMTGMPPGPAGDAAHIIPHSKMDEVRVTCLLILLQVFNISTKYMCNFVSIRSRPDNDLQLNSIDDTRNGLLLHLMVHSSLTGGAMAFLKVSLIRSHYLPPY